MGKIEIILTACYSVKQPVPVFSRFSAVQDHTEN